MVSHARCTTDFDGCGQYLWACPMGVAMKSGHSGKKKLELHEAHVPRANITVK